MRIQDAWTPIRPFFNAFNERRMEVIEPGRVIVVNECMSEWQGKNGKYHAEGMPQVTKIIRKPKGVGCELKSACDGEPNILLRLEIQEGAEEMKLKMFSEHRPADQRTGEDIHPLFPVTLRLVEPWLKSWRLVVGDSAFASVGTCLALLQHGMHFIGTVITATRKFPAAYFKFWAENNHNTTRNHIYRLVLCISPWIQSI